MPEIDPITREALRRASYMQGKGSQPPVDHEPKPPEPEHKPERSAEPARRPVPTLFGNGLDAIFKDKETGVILILIILLMGEKDSENLLLALIYLLI